MAALDLVPEEQVALRELKLFQIVLLAERYANTIKRRKQPAAAAALLVGHRFAFGFDLNVVQCKYVCLNKYYNRERGTLWAKTCCVDSMVWRDKHTSNGSTREHTFWANRFFGQV